MPKEKPYIDSLSFLAERKTKELDEKRIRDAAFEKLIQQVSSSRGRRSESQESIDTLGRFIQEIVISQAEKKKILSVFQDEIKKEKKIKTTPKATITSVRRESEEKNKEIHKRPNIKALLEKMKGVVDGDILSRFPTAYRNYLSMPQHLRDSIYKLSQVFGLTHTHVLGLIANESHFDEKARSPVGAEGLTQVMPGNKSGWTRFVENSPTKNVGPEEKFFALLRNDQDFMNIYNAGGSSKNLALGIAYLGYLTQRYGEKSLRIYNGGIRFPNNKENMDYTRRVREFAEAFEHIIPDDRIYTAQK